MAYAAFSVVFGEQPSAAKWNILGSNDASFNDGTGIANMALNTTSIYNPYKFRVYRAAAYTTTAVTTTRYLFDTKSYDTNTNIDVVTNKGRYTAPVDGFYHFSSSISVNATTGFFIIQLGVNGSIVATGTRSFGTVAQTQVMTISADYQLSATDYAEILYYTDGAQVSPTGSSNNWFTGHLISQT